jgi:hypothetical protein
VSRAFTDGIDDKVGRAQRCAGNVGRRQEGEQLLRDRADAICGDGFVGKRCPPRAVGIARRRVVNIGGRVAKVAGAPFQDRNDVAVDLAELVVGVLVIAKVKQFVLDDWAA